MFPVHRCMGEDRGLNLLDVERRRLSPGNIRKIRTKMSHCSVDLCENLWLCRLRIEWDDGSGIRAM